MALCLLLFSIYCFRFFGVWFVFGIDCWMVIDFCMFLLFVVLCVF